MKPDWHRRHCRGSSWLTTAVSPPASEGDLNPGPTSLLTAASATPHSQLWGLSLAFFFRGGDNGSYPGGLL